MDPFIVGWIVGWIVLVFGTIFWMAWTDTDLPEAIIAVIFLGSGWPLIIPVMVPIGLGWAFYKGVRYVRQRHFS